MPPLLRRARAVVLLCALGALLAACAPPSPLPTPTPPPAGVVGTVPPDAATAAPGASTAAPEAPATTPEAPTAPSGPTTPTPQGGARPYDLGQADVTVMVSNDAEEPLELRGTVAAPAAPGAYPVVAVLHGSHSVCPMQPPSPEEPQICPQATQFRNDPGLAYLLDTLAARGYIAVAPDLNTAFRAEFGGLQEEYARLRFILDENLERLAGGDPAFGIAPGVTPDPARLFLVGHSRGANGSFDIATEWAATSPAPGGWGQARGLLLVAPTLPHQDLDFAAPLDVPLAVILPECDGDASFLEGQHYVEAARLDPARRAPAVSYFLPGANHNFFNTAVAVDDGQSSYSRCLAETPRLPRDAQQALLAGLAPTLLATWEAGDVSAIPAFDPARPVPSSLYGAPALALPLRPAEQRRALLPGISSAELATSPLGGAVAAEGAELDFCPYGMTGSGSPCRAGVENPGLPAQLHLAWDSPEAALRVAVPPAFADASQAVALQLRLAVDPLDPRSPVGTPQQLRLVLRDSAGAEASQLLSVAFPQGQVVRERWFGHVFAGMQRLPLSGFTGIDLSQLAAVELRPETPSGALFLADLELVSDQTPIAGPPPPSPYRSLDVSVAAPELAEAPAGSTLFLRLLPFVGADEERRFVTIQSHGVAGAAPFSQTIRYHQAAIDERLNYFVEADLSLADGQSFTAPFPVPAGVGGVGREPVVVAVQRVVIVEPTPIPTDAVFRLTVQAPAGRPFPAGATINASISQLDAGGMAVTTIATVTEIVEGAPADTVVVEIPYASNQLVAGAPYAVGVDVFGPDGIARLSGTGGNIPVDLGMGEASVALAEP